MTCVCVCVCACSSAYYFCPDVFTVQRFFAFCLVALMGRFVPLPGTAFFCGTTSTPEEEVEEKEDEEEEELLPSSEVAALSLPLDESLSAEDLDSTELASSSGFQSQSERPREASEKDTLSLSTAFATFKVILGGPQVGKLATSPLPYQGSPPLQSGGQNQKWPTSGQIGYLTPAVSGIPAASERGAKSEVAHKWAKWLPHPCRIGDPRRCRAGGKNRSGPQVGKLASSPLPYRGSPPLQSGGQNQKWPTSGQIGYLTPAVSGIPAASERGAKSEVAHKWAKWLPHPCRIGDPRRCRAGGKIRSGPQVGKLATSPLPYRGSPSLWSGDPRRFRAGGKIRSGPQVGKVATSPLPYRGSPPLQSGGQNQKWPTSGQIGYLTPAVSGIPAAAKRGAK